MQKSCEQEKKIKKNPRCPIIVFPSVCPILCGHFVCIEAPGLYPRQHWSDTSALLKRRQISSLIVQFVFLIIGTDCFLPLRMGSCVQSGELFAIGVCTGIR